MEAQLHLNKMKKFLAFLLLISSIAEAQPISQMPTYIGNPADAWMPIVISNTNRKIASNVFFNSQFVTKTTADLAESANLYFTQARVRAALSVSGTGISYNAATGVFSADYTALDARYTTDLIFGPTIKITGEVTPQLDVDLTKLSRYKKTIADANYIITIDDEVIVLPDPAATRTATLPAASTMPGMSITIVCAATSTGEWVLMGSFVQTATTGTSPFIENFTNSGLAPGQRLNLHSINDNGTWRWFDLY